MYTSARLRSTTTRQPARRRVPTRSNDLLTLQRQAGNQAVAGLIAAQRTPVTVQRADDKRDVADVGHDDGGGEHDDGGEHDHDGGGAGAPPAGWDDGRAPIPHRDHMIINDLCMAVGAQESAAYFENLSSRSQYALRDLAAKYLDAWTDFSRRRIAARMAAIGRNEERQALGIHHDWIRERKARPAAEPRLVHRQPHLRSNWGKKLAGGGVLAALAGGAAAATLGALHPGAVSGLLGKIGLNIPGLTDSPKLAGAVAGGGAVLAIGALAGVIGLGIWAGRKLTGKNRAPLEFANEVSRTEATSNEAQARYEAARGTGNAALAQLRQLPPESAPPGNAVRSYQHALACGNEARNALEECFVALHAYRARLEPLRPIDEIVQYVIDTPGARLRSRDDPNRPGEDARTYATYLWNLVRAPDNEVPPQPAWPAVAGGALPAALPELGHPNLDPDWRPRVVARVKNVQRQVAREILRKRGVEPAQAAAMTPEQLAYRLAGLTPPRRRASEEQAPALVAADA